jgi:hypothetical protein
MKRLFFAGEIPILVHEFLISVDPNVFRVKDVKSPYFCELTPPFVPMAEPGGGQGLKSGGATSASSSWKRPAPEEMGSAGGSRNPMKTMGFHGF